jgi:hypothetical protein
LTGYAVLSGKIKECGCFGDCIKLTADQSFMKDLVLFIMIGFMLLKKDQVKSILGHIVSIVMLSSVTLAAVAVQVYVLANLPIVDCLPYKKGVSITEKMKIPSDAIQDSTVITFVYAHDGKEIEFDTDHFPEDFNDSTYSFVKRYDKLIRKGNAQPEIKDFVIIAPSGADTTMDILSQQGKILVLFAKTLPNGNAGWITDFTRVLEDANKRNIPVIAVSSDATNMATFLTAAQIHIPVCKGDLVAIKTAARSNPTLYLLEQGVILNKWGRAAICDFSFD